MKESLALLATIDVERFYVCTIWANEVRLQGRANSDTLKYCRGIGVETFETSSNGIEAKIGSIYITLT